MTGITTNIATSDTQTITIRGKNLVDELIGRYSYTEILYFLICDRLPSAAETRVLDACLVTLMEHGFTPTSLISRLVIDSVPGEVQVAIASGLMAIGSVFVGTMEDCARILKRGLEEGGDRAAYCRQVITEHRAVRRALPGFGHPFHKPDDPRTPRLFAVAAEAGVKGDYIALLKMLSAEIDRAFGKHLTINATGAIGALLLEIGIPPEIMRGVAVVSRCGGLTGHILEEQRTHSARHIWQLAEENIPYEAPHRA
jgi:citrate synthase